MRKKFLVLFLVFGLVFSGVSKAFIFLGAPAVGLMSAGEIASALTGLGIGALIGQQMGWIELPSLNPSTDDNVRIPLTDLSRDRPSRDTTNLPVSTPEVNPATTTGTLSCSQFNYTAQGGSANCSYFLDYTYTNNATNPNKCDEHGQYRPNDTSGCPGGYVSSYDMLQVANAAVTCPSGYTKSGTSCLRDAATPACNVGYTSINGSCSLTNPQAIPDGKADIEVVNIGGALMYRPVADDPDQNAGLTISQGAALFNMMHPNYGTDPASAQPVEVAIDPMGGTTSMCPYQTCIPIQGLPGHFRISALSNTATGGQAVVIDVNKATGIVDQAAVVPLAGYVLNQGQTYIDTNGVTQTVGAGQIAIANPSSTGTYVQSATNAVPTVQINTADLAKTGEAANAANTVVQALNTNLQDTALDNVTPMTSINASFDALNDNLTPKPENQPDINFSWMPSLMPGTFTACTPFIFDVNPTLGAASGMTGSGSIDICDKLDLARQILGWMIGALTAFLIFRIFVNSNKGAL